MALLPYVDEKNAPPSVRELIERTPIKLNVFLMLANSEAAVRPFGQLGNALLTKSKLDAKQLATVDAALRRGPRSFGFTSARWTLWRVATVIERMTGVHYHPSSVWRILRTLGWKLRLPSKSDRRGKAYIPREWAAPVKKRAKQR